MTRSAGASRDVLAIRTLGLDWGVAGDDIEEVVPHRTAVRAPGSAPFVEGIVRYRDGILPVVDLSRRFRLPPGSEPPPPPRPEARRTLVVRISGGLAGLTVDEVVGSRPVGDDGLAPLPRLVTSPIVRGCLIGDDEQVLVVLDARRILETDEPLDLPLPLGGRPGEEEVPSSSALPGAPTPMPARSEVGARPGPAREPAAATPGSSPAREAPPAPPGWRPARAEPGAPPGPAGTPPRGPLHQPARHAAAPPPPPPVPPRAVPEPPRAVPEPPRTAPEPTPERIRPAATSVPPAAPHSALPGAPSSSPPREPAGAPPSPSPAREPADDTRPGAWPLRPAPAAPPPSSGREPAGAPPGPPPRRPERPPAARPAPPAVSRPAAGPGEARPAVERTAPGRPAAFARPGGVERGVPPGAYPPPSRTAPGASPDWPADLESSGRTRPGRWIAAAAALLVVLGTGLVLATRPTREPPASVAVRLPAGGVPAALPVAPSPLPAGTMPVAPPSSSPARESAGVAARPAPAGPLPSPARTLPGAPHRRDRLVLTLEERQAEGASPEAGEDPGEAIEEVVDYTVVRGDTLWHIARRFTKNPFHYREIASDNDLRNPHLIFPGQQLTLRIRRLAPPTSPSP